jgi:hypothetical protein
LHRRFPHCPTMPVIANRDPPFFLASTPLASA